MLVDPGLQQREQSTLIATTWNRATRAGLAWSANLTYGRGVVRSGAGRHADHWHHGAAAGRAGRTRWRGRGELAPPDRRSVARRAAAGQVPRTAAPPEFGASASWTASTRQAPGASIIGELVDGEPARVWEYTTDGGRRVARHRARALGDRRDSGHVPRRHRSRHARGVGRRLSAGEGGSITWRALSPSILGTYRAHSTTAGSRSWPATRSYASRLPLNYLAFGDPHSLTGVVRRWNDVNRDQRPQPGESGVVVAAVGPCCANGRPNTIADDLSAPRMKEVRAALQTRLPRPLVLRLGGTDRRTSTG